MTMKKPSGGDNNIHGNRNSNIISSSHIEGDVQNTVTSGDQTTFDIDLAALSDELVILREALKERAEDSSHYAALASVAQAEEAARDNDKSAVVQRLKQAGQWTLSVAQSIGVPLAVAALKQALHIG